MLRLDFREHDVRIEVRIIGHSTITTYEERGKESTTVKEEGEKAIGQILGVGKAVLSDIPMENDDHASESVAEYAKDEKTDPDGQ